MGIEETAGDLLEMLLNLTGSVWLGKLLTVVICLTATAFVVRAASKFLRRILNRNDSPLPSSSIFINIVRVVIWALGLSVIASSVFGVDVSALVTALGVGGIAISLGLQDTISNLISGLQVSLMGIVHPGDNIQVGSQTGVVKDVTWRHTVITNSFGEEISIPNSTINTTSLAHLKPTANIRLSISVATDGKDLEELAKKIEQAAREALLKETQLEKDPVVSFTEATEFGFTALLMFTIGPEITSSRAKDIALRATAPYLR